MRGLVLSGMGSVLINHKGHEDPRREPAFASFVFLRALCGLVNLGHHPGVISSTQQTTEDGMVHKGYLPAASRVASLGGSFALKMRSCATFKL